MVFLWIVIGIGILIAAILIIKASKTNSREFIGTYKYCRNCGTETKGLKCPKCKNKSQSFGV